MTADANVTEKVADRIARARGYVQGACVEEHYRDAREALAVLSDPEVLAGIAGVLGEHTIDGRKTWGWVYCSCGWVSREADTATGYRRHREHAAGAVLVWLRGQG